MGRFLEIAQQGTLTNEIIPAQWVNDYKLHGENSFVFNTPDLWHKMCIHPYTVNDRRVNGDALEYVLTVAAPGGTFSLSNWMALLCDTAEQAAAGLYAGLETADQLAQSSAAMAAVSISETAMAAVTGSETAMNAICGVEMALEYLHNSPHWDECVKENSMAIAKAAVALANSDEFSAISSVAEMAENSSAMSAVAASATAMSAVADSNTARTAISASEYYNQYIKENDMAIAKLAVGFAGLASAGYSGMAGVAADATAMTAVAASSTAMTAVAASGVALNAIAKYIPSGLKLTFLKALNVSALIKSAYNTCSASNLFTKTTIGNYDGVTEGNAQCTAANAANAFIMCACGYYSNGGSVNVLFNGTTLASGISSAGSKPSSVTSSNVNVITMAPSTFTENNDGHVAIEKFTAK